MKQPQNSIIYENQSIRGSAIIGCISMEEPRPNTADDRIVLYTNIPKENDR